jgi:hypothetical protein
MILVIVIVKNSQKVDSSIISNHFGILINNRTPLSCLISVGVKLIIFMVIKEKLRCSKLSIINNLIIFSTVIKII